MTVLLCNLKLQKLYKIISRIIGRPNDNVIGSVNVVHFSKHSFRESNKKTTEIPIHDNLSQLGINSI